MPSPPISLATAIAMLRDEREVGSFLTDLTTPAERDALAERWRIAQLLAGGDLSYRQIAKQTGASTTTIARVARFLKATPDDGYQLIIDRLGLKQ